MTGSVLDFTPTFLVKTTISLLRHAENEPLQAVAVCFRVSPSRISKIQQAIARPALLPEQVQAFARCKVKN